MITIEVVTFQSLSLLELYDVLRLRIAVFVVEQNCVYQDLDDMDVDALHVIGRKDDKIIAYTRILKPSAHFEEACIGRVVVTPSQRQFKYGYDIMFTAINAVQEHFKTNRIKISAQSYLTKFYNKLGFEEEGATYLEDGIEHIHMIRKVAKIP